MDKNKQKQEIKVIGRLFSLEALLVVMGLLSLITGINAGDAVRIVLGAVLLGGLFLFIFFRMRSAKR